MDEFRVMHITQQGKDRLAGSREKRGALKRKKGGTAARLAYSMTGDLTDNLCRSIDFIQKNLAKPIYLEELAGAACLSKYHFCRLFRQRLGVRPMKFIALVRICEAETLLLRTNLTVSAVARRVGFNGLDDFSRQFKGIVGMTPTAFKGSRATSAGDG